MPSPVGTSLVSAFDFVWARFTARLEGLTDDEYLWAPVPDSWSIHPDGRGGWVADDGPASDPPPITTIAWRIGHIGGSVLGGFTTRCFPELRAAAPLPPLPGSARAVPAYLDACYQPWRTGIAGLEDGGWWAELGPAWGPYAESNVVDVALHVLDEVIHHGAEVALLRDLYLRRGMPVT